MPKCRSESALCFRHLAGLPLPCSGPQNGPMVSMKINTWRMPDLASAVSHYIMMLKYVYIYIYIEFLWFGFPGFSRPLWQVDSVSCDSAEVLAHYVCIIPPASNDCRCKFAVFVNLSSHVSTVKKRTVQCNGHVQSSNLGPSAHRLWRCHHCPLEKCQVHAGNAGNGRHCRLQKLSLSRRSLGGNKNSNIELQWLLALGNMVCFELLEPPWKAVIQLTRVLKPWNAAPSTPNSDWLNLSR